MAKGQSTSGTSSLLKVRMPTAMDNNFVLNKVGQENGSNLKKSSKVIKVSIITMMVVLK